MSDRGQKYARAVSILAILFLASCGASSLRLHAQAGTAVNEVAIATRAAVMVERQHAIDLAAAAAQVNGADVAAARHAAGAAFDATPLVKAVDAFIAADHAYALAVQAWTADANQRVHVAAALFGVLVAYEQLREAVAGRVELPALPKQVTDLIGGGL